MQECKVKQVQEYLIKHPLSNFRKVAKKFGVSLYFVRQVFLNTYIG
jgi:hypothetical protein